ncbi:MAG TPA: cytochrome C nitrite reductase [Syntrophaceticus sp.]|nr:cytochrome C nitrite reductase [Syntrophaceticus sp.]
MGGTGINKKILLWDKKKILLLILAVPFLLIGTFLLMKQPVISSAMDGPGFCGRCHVMQPYIETYLASSHREAATCGSCHVPYDFLRGGIYKSYTGTKDLLAVLTGRDEHIRISELGKGVVQENCLRCHNTLMREIGDTMEKCGSYCFDCHRGVPHLK